jgi:diguanylate cyclase (GGDEF)-like protein
MGDSPRETALVADADEDILYESDRTRVVRAFDTSLQSHVIHKEPLGPDTQRRLRRERSIIARLDGVEGVARLAGSADVPGILTMVDLQASSLAAVISWGRPSVADLFAIAVELADVVTAIHARGVTHRDINPSNILWSSSPPRLHLIDFDSATTAAEELPGFTHEREITGTLAYLAPEQTGRTGRPADRRVDLYGIGTTLYELAVGSPPFGFGDPLQLVHDHLTTVPVAPSERNPEVPASLSMIIMRLLEKEPDRRYQSAEGLAYDLRSASNAWSGGLEEPMALGGHDFPLRLSAPSRLIGRTTEIETLRRALEGARSGEGGRGLLLSGVPGVGKSALLDQLRPLVTGCGGWFVMGKFDQYRQDWEADGVRQALRRLGLLLLAAPEEEIVDLRSSLRESLGPNAELVAGMVKEFALVLDVSARPPEGDPTTVHTRLNQAAVELVRAVASRVRPVVVAVDDLQWAPQSSLGFLDTLLLDPRLHDVLVVGAYRDTEVDAAHPLATLLARWQRLGVVPPRLAVTNLAAPALSTMLGEMLRIDEPDAVPLAEAIGPRTDGNPYDTVELVNSLRREGLLAAGADGWRWDTGALRRRLGHESVVGILVTRLAGLPRRTRLLLETMACLGGEVALDLLGEACDLPAETVEDHLRAALEEGLIIHDEGDASVRFRHDRVQQAAFGFVSPADRARTRLAVARRLSARYGRELVAAEQYLDVVDEVADPAEQLGLVGLFRTAGAQATAMADYPRAERFVSAATALLAPQGPVTVDHDTAVELAIERHTALYSLGRLEELDEAYGKVVEATRDPLTRARAALLHVVSLTNQNRMGEALELGTDLLRELGAWIPSDPDELAAEIGRGLAVLDRWLASGDASDDARRPPCTDERVLATGRLLDRLNPTAFFANHPTWPLLGLEAARLWAEHGPAAELAGPICYTSFATIALRDDYRSGSEALRRALNFCETKDWEPITSHIRAAYALSCAPWSDTLDSAVHQARAAHKGLVASGELQHACHTYYSTIPFLLDSASALDDVLAEVDDALAFTTRTGNEHAAGAYLTYRQFVATVRGETDESCGVVAGEVDDDAYLASLAANPTAAAYFHPLRGLAAAVMGRTGDLLRHAAAIPALMPFIDATFITSTAHVVQALALAHRLRRAGDDERQEVLAAFDAELAWLAARAVAAPSSFLHLQHWMEAERARALGDHGQATRLFDRVLDDLIRRPRLWHRALVAERAAQLQEESGLHHTAAVTLLEARSCYERWGATAKVTDLDRTRPELRTLRSSRVWAHHGSVRFTDSQGSGRHSTEEIDLLAVIKASQALSSETNLGRLLSRVQSVLRSMTGATSVRLALRDDARGWSTTTEDGVELSLDTQEARKLLPRSALRYVQRVHEVVVVDDVARDDRFGRDPYFAGQDSCSLVVVPVSSQGRLRAMLFMENRLARAAFADDMLDGVRLIAGQLAVSLENVLLYSSLERKVAERTEALGTANRRLEMLSATDALTGLANRRHLTDSLAEVWRLKSGTKDPIAVAMIDIDHFKLYNDRYGHPAGDRCLRRVAAVLSEKVRSSDTVARYGGEEFVIIMPGVDITIAERVADRVRKAVAALGQIHEDSPQGVVTVSVGVAAALPSEGGCPEDLVQFADVLLYKAKNSGRNRTEPGRMPDDMSS